MIAEFNVKSCGTTFFCNVVNQNESMLFIYVCVSIQYRDGSSQELEVNCSSEWDENSGNVHVWARISLYDVLGTFLDLDEVQSVTVNDVVIQIPS